MAHQRKPNPNGDSTIIAPSTFALIMWSSLCEFLETPPQALSGFRPAPSGAARGNGRSVTVLEGGRALAEGLFGSSSGVQRRGAPNALLGAEAASIPPAAPQSVRASHHRS